MSSESKFTEYIKKFLQERQWSTEGRDAARIDEILAAIEKVWKQYPDMRLGQLLICLCKKTDLFYVEDDELLEHIKEGL